VTVTFSLNLSRKLLLKQIKKHENVNGSRENSSHRYLETGISVLVAGRGIAGLVMALESAQNGHGVTVLEARPRNDPAGLSLSLFPF
jgi:heterodisulfide reductase subunit A-like polyferredoxin